MTGVKMLLPFSHSRRWSAVLAFLFLTVVTLSLWNRDEVLTPASSPANSDEETLTGGAASLIPSSGTLHPDSIPSTEKSKNVPIVLSGTDNATLGFETILAVSPEKTWRSEGLKAAAARTHLSITIPLQRKSTEPEIEEFLARSRSGSLNRGSAKAWLAHLQVLATAGNFTTALIMEDDVDWDVRIHDQARIISAAIRNLTETTTGVTQWPWANEWDILWLGHCGERLPFEEEKEDEEELEEAEEEIEEPTNGTKPNSDSAHKKKAEEPWDPYTDDYITYFDATLPDSVSSYDGRINDEPNTRWVQWAAGPICTFAYAVNRESTAKMLAMQHGNEQAFDLWMHTRCRNRELRCFSANPEIFHHHRAAGLASSLVNEGEVSDANGRNTTANIVYSARCNVGHGDDELVSCLE